MTCELYSSLSIISFYNIIKGDGSNFGKGNPETTQVTIPNDVKICFHDVIFEQKNGEKIYFFLALPPLALYSNYSFFQLAGGLYPTQTILIF